MPGNATEPGRSVLSRAMAVLDSFDRDHRVLTATEVSARSGLPLTTAHRLLGEFVATGALSRRADRYAIGHRIWALALLAPVQTGLRDVAAPYLQDIYATTRATVHLAVRDGDRVLYLDRIAGRQGVPVVSTVGGRLPLHTTGVGKVLLAHAPEPVQNRVLAELTRETPYSVTHPARLREQLRRVRQQGFAVTAEEMSLGASSVAVPIRASAREPEDADDEVIAALGLVLPRLGRDRQRLVAVLQVAARGIGRTVSPHYALGASAQWKSPVAPAPPEDLRS